MTAFPFTPSLPLPNAMTRSRHVWMRRLSGRAVALPFVVFGILTTFACSLDKLTAPTTGGDKPTFTVTGDSTLGLGATMPMSLSSSTGGTVNSSTASIYWDSQNESVAVVDHGTGVVTAVGLGTASITATVSASELGQVEAVAKQIRVKYAGIKIATVDSLIAIGMTKVITVRGTNAAGATQAVIPFSASTMQVVSRDATIYDVNSSGALVAKANGTARLFVQYDGLKDSLNVKVRQVARSLTFPTAVNNELAIQSINKDRTLQLTPRDSLNVAITGSTVAWSTSDATTVTVGAATGVARGLKLGTARIRATVDGKTDSILARVTQVAGVINKLAGDAQSATVGTAVSTLPMVAVLDSGNTPIPNASVTFAVASGGGSVTGATPTASGTGQASVGSWTLGTTAGANTLTASADGASATFTATGTPGVATKLIFTTQPSNSPSGAPLTTFRVAVADANDNVVTTATNSISVTVGSGAGTMGGTQTASAVAGVATFSAVTLSATGAYTITASATSLTPVTSNSFAVFGPATKLGFTTQPVGNTATIPMQAFRVAVQDAAGNTVTSGAASTSTVTLTLNTGSFSAGSTVSVAAVAGVATFSNVAAAAAGTFTIGATATGLTAATSNSFTVAAVGPAAKLAFTVQPANGTAGAALADIKVTVQDANGVTNTSSTAAITLGIETNVGGSTISAGVTTVNAVAGVATFSGIALNKAGVGYRLNATSGALTKGVSNTFNIVAGAAFKLGFAAAIPNSVIAQAITPAVQVQVQDANGNLVAGATNSITITAAGGTGTLSGGAATAATAGVATFSGLALSAAGTYTLAATSSGLQTGTSTSFNVVSATAAIKLAFITQPSNVAAGTVVSPNIQVAVQDASGNTVSSTAQITLSIATGPNGASVTSPTKSAIAGVATFDATTFPLAGTGYSLNAVATNLTAATSNTFNVNPGNATKLAWVVQPQNSTAGVPFANDIQVAILDAANNLVTTATNTVTISYGSNPGGGGAASLKGTLSVSAINGIATLPGIRLTRAAAGFTLTATATGLSQSTSSTFDITPAPATALTFRQQPSFVAAGAQQTSAIQVAITDSLGNTVTTATNSITLAINSGPAGATMNGTATQAAVAGLASFADVTFTKQGNHTLSATATDLATATSGTFFVTSAAATKLGFSVQPTNTFVNAPMNPGTNQVVVQVQDPFGNPVNSNASITLALGTVPAAAAGAVLSGTLTNAASFGSMSVPNDVKINKAGNGFTLTATSTGLTSATTDAFNVIAFSTPNQLGWLQQPQDVNPGATFATPISVGIVDSYGNVVTSAAPLQITIGCTTNCTQSTSNQVTTSSGVANFPAFTVSTAGSLALFMSSNLYGGPVSNTFTVASTTVATTSIGSTGAYDIAISGSTAYFIERAAGSGAIRSVPTAGGSPATLASGLNNPAALVTDGVNVYWIEDGSGLVKRVPVGGGAVTTMSTVQSGMAQLLQTDGTSLFFVANNAGNTQREIKKLALNAAAGTAPTTFYTAGCGTTCTPAFTITGTTMYFWRSQDNSISSLSTGGGVPAAVVTSVTTEPQSIAFGNNALWFTSAGRLYNAPSNVGPTTANDFGQYFNVTGTTVLAFNGTHIYGLDQANSLLRRLNVNDFTHLFVTNMVPGTNSRAIAFDASFIYFADSSSPTKIRRVSK